MWGFCNFREIAWLITPGYGCGTDFATSRYKTVHGLFCLTLKPTGSNPNLNKKITGTPCGRT